MPSTVLTKRIAHQERQESAAIWDFNQAHDPLASKPEPLVNARTSAFASCGHAVAYALARFVPSADICSAANLQPTRSPRRLAPAARAGCEDERFNASHSRRSDVPDSYCQKPERVPRSSLPASENLHMSRRCLPECSASVRRARGRRKEGSALDQKGKRENQGFAVLATRKPSVSNRTLVWRLLRTAARTSSLSLRQEPPRTTRKLGSPPRSHANPSAGAPS
jgi:hypothetical protein